MHELFHLVLSRKDLSKAGDLFLVADDLIEPDIYTVISQIRDISSQPDYTRNQNDQSIVEICLTRVTSAIRDTSSIEKHTASLVALLESCLSYNLRPLGQDEEPPHAKIAAEIISCIFLNYSRREVMKLVLPVAVKFLHKGNVELSRNLSSYLCLASLQNADLLTSHGQPIIDSIIAGNYQLCRVLPHIYPLCKERIHNHCMTLVSLLPHCAQLPENIALLQLYQLIAVNKPKLVECCMPQLLECLSSPPLAAHTMQLFVNMAGVYPQAFIDHINKFIHLPDTQPQLLHSVTQLLSAVGRCNKELAKEAIAFLSGSVRLLTEATLRELVTLCDLYPALLTEPVITLCTNAVKDATDLTDAAQEAYQHLLNEYNAIRWSYMKDSYGGVNIRICGGMRGCKSGDVGSVSARSVTKLTQQPNVAYMARSSSKLSSIHGSGSYKSMTRLSSSQQIHSSLNHINPGQRLNTSPTKSISGSLSALREEKDRLGSCTVNLTPTHTHNKGSAFSTVSPTHSTVSPRSTPVCEPTVSPTHCEQTHASMQSEVDAYSDYTAAPTTTVVIRHNTTRDSPNDNQRISVFEPYPMRDGVQHFCEKHLEKIKSYMNKVFLTLPLPVKCTIEERRSRKLEAKLHFGCHRHGSHCLYDCCFFTIKTNYGSTWIHLMFLALQARSPSALSTREASVSSLKNCWDILNRDNKSFLTVVTSAFPSTKEVEILLGELDRARLFDVFTVFGVSGEWGCFLCAYPERAPHPDTPLIQGVMKEKRGKWKMFKRWRTKYFTLSGGHLSSRTGRRDSWTAPIELNEIRSVRAISRGTRNIPKAFEIFTSERQSFVLKPKDGKKAEEWVQCLSIAVAHSQTSGYTSNSLKATTRH